MQATKDENGVGAIQVGAILEGKISGITNFGAFVDLPAGKTGLVHISEIAREYVKDIREHVQMGQVVRVMVVSSDNKGKIGWSIKKVLEAEARRPSVGKPADIDWSVRRDDPDASFEDKMARFKADSDERMQHVKRSFEPKRGGYHRSGNGSY